MDDNQKISILLSDVRDADEKFDFSKMSKYLDDKWDLQLLEKHPEAASISNRGALYYSALLLNKLKATLSEQESEKIADECVNRGYPLYEWSIEKNYYHFAKELTEALIRQADYFKGDGGDLPIKVLDSLPSKCGFVSFDIINHGWMTLKNYRSVVGSLFYEIIGFIFVVKENGDKSGKHINICLVNYNGSTYIGNTCFYIPADTTLKIEDVLMDSNAEDISAKLGISEERIKEHNEMWINIAIQHLLYLCSDGADIVLSSEDAVTSITNKSIRVKREDVGVNISGKLSSIHSDDNSLGVKSRYIRRAHWHNRWVGKVNSAERRLVLQWQHPSLVNIRYRAWSELSEETKEEEERADHDLELQLSHFSERSDFTAPYIDEPIARPDKPREIKSVYTYPRSKRIAVNALHHANYQCEISSEHQTFIRKRSKIPYVEPHHLIPLAFQDDFEVSLDREQNIIALCCNCHKRIHLG